MFIKSTSLIKTWEGDQVTGNPIIPTIVNTFTGTKDLDNAIKDSTLSILESEKGAYQVKYNLKCFYLISVRGEQDNQLIIDVDIWVDKASYNKGDAPSLQNTFIFAIRDRLNLEDHIKRHIENYIIRSSLNGNLGDRRDLTRTPIKSGSLYSRTQTLHAEFTEHK